MKAQEGVELQIHALAATSVNDWIELPATSLQEKEHPVPIEKEVGWIPVPVRILWRRRKFPPPLEMQPQLLGRPACSPDTITTYAYCHN